MLHKVRQTIKKHRLLHPGERILIGVSGGADSVALLVILNEVAKEEAWELHVAHVEHGLRGQESVEDAEFVQKLCAQLGVPFHMGQPAVKKYAAEHGMSTEVAARELRYRFFQETGQAVGATKLALAHHADDQAETVLMRVLRGTSVSGLAGIPLRRQMAGLEIVRPLLDVGRDEIEKYCRTTNIPYRTDSSNALTDYFRNKIRLQLIPLLQSEYNGNIKQALIRLGKIAAEEDRYLDHQAESRLQEVVVERSDRQIKLHVKRLLESPIALQRRVITLILYYLCGHTNEWEAKHIEQVLSLADHSSPSARISLLNGMEAWREYEYLHIGTKAGVIPAAVSVELPVPHWGETLQKSLFFEVPELRLKGSVELLAGPISPVDPWEAVFDYDQVKGEKFQFRVRRQGDFMSPHGMTGTKKLKEILMEARVPRDKRDLWPLLVLEDRIVWVPGIRRSDSALVRPDTRLSLRVRVDYPVQR